MGERGTTSDVNLFRKQQENFDKRQKFQGDKGDQGGERITTPKKKPRKKEMPEEIKEENRRRASEKNICRACNEVNKNI